VMAGHLLVPVPFGTFFSAPYSHITLFYCFSPQGFSPFRFFPLPTGLLSSLKVSSSDCGRWTSRFFLKPFPFSSSPPVNLSFTFPFIPLQNLPPCTREPTDPLFGPPPLLPERWCAPPLPWLFMQWIRRHPSPPFLSPPFRPFFLIFLARRLPPALLLGSPASPRCKFRIPSFHTWGSPWITRT